MHPHPARPDAISIRRDVVYREIDGDIVAVSIATGDYVSLDAIGSDIWRHIERLGSLDKIKAALVSDYELDGETCEREVEAFVATLEAKGLITCGSS